MIPSAVLLFLSASGMETALLITGLLTILAVLIVLISLILPEEDRRTMAASFARVRQYLLTGTTERVGEFDHDFDGIRELDNRIPPWFTTLFLATVVFAGIYLLDYHVFKSSKLMVAEYQDEVAAAEVQRRIAIASEGSIDENARRFCRCCALKRGGRNSKVLRHAMATAAKGSSARTSPTNTGSMGEGSRTSMPPSNRAFRQKG
jgi:hypothetical protein